MNVAILDRELEKFLYVFWCVENCYPTLFSRSVMGFRKLAWYFLCELHYLGFLLGFCCDLNLRIMMVNEPLPTNP
jgi:hypothetical protein